MADMIRIANAGGYWGDDLAQFRRQIELGPVDVVTLDFLAEITMSIMQKQRARDHKSGYARDFIGQVESALPLLVERGVKVITNAGGVNPLACRGTLMERIQQHGHQLEVVAVVGDDLMERLGELNATGVSLDHMDDGSSFQSIRERVSSANAYFGAWPVVEALKSGAQIVVTGRCTDTGITLAPMIHAFGWARERLGPARLGHRRRAHHRVWRAVDRRQLYRLARGEALRSDRLSGHRGPSRRLVRGHQATGHRRTRCRCAP